MLLCVDCGWWGKVQWRCIKAMCAGADMVMVGGMFAECVDSLAKISPKLFRLDFLKVKIIDPLIMKAPNIKMFAIKGIMEVQVNLTRVIPEILRVCCERFRVMILLVWKNYEMTMDLQSSVSYAGGSNLSCLINTEYLLV